MKIDRDLQAGLIAAFLVWMFMNMTLPEKGTYENFEQFR